MRELTKKQKLKVLAAMIKIVNSFDGLCVVYKNAMQELKYKQDENNSWTPGFKELNDKIRTEITGTGGGGYINYGWNKDVDQFDSAIWKSGRLKLLKNLKKEISV